MWIEDLALPQDMYSPLLEYPLLFFNLVLKWRDAMIMLMRFDSKLDGILAERIIYTHPLLWHSTRDLWMHPQMIPAGVTSLETVTSICDRWQGA